MLFPACALALPSTRPMFAKDTGTREKAMAARKVLLPFDGSPPARRALEYVAAMDHGGDFHVHVLYVQAPTINDEVYLQPLLDEAERIVRVASRYLDARSISHTTGVIVGYPSDTIVRSANAERCTDIVMGVRSSIARFFSGSVSRRVASLAGTPVTLVKATGEAIVRRPGSRQPAHAAPG